MGDTMSAGDLADLIAAHIYGYRDEAGLHNLIALAFAGAGVPIRREVALSRRDRIDFLVGRVGLEVKVKGAPAGVLRQLQRYAGSDQIGHLVLVTTVARHLDMPATIGGKPLTVCPLMWGSL